MFMMLNSYPGILLELMFMPILSTSVIIPQKQKNEQTEKAAQPSTPASSYICHKGGTLGFASLPSEASARMIWQQSPK